ncbi:hypothetical protein ABE504_23775 [Paenibacillus oryzisoli]|uniref:hypothetical protein n=1 Tax=Paenibacillus oryzisoli TaxID=1850517 RepID=UPI003D2B02E1
MNVENILYVRVRDKHRAGRNKIKLEIEIADKLGGLYLTVLQKDTRGMSMDSIKFGRLIKQDAVLFPNEKRRKCQLCDKHHFKGYCRFNDGSKREAMRTEIFHSIRLKALMDGTFSNRVTKSIPTK